AAVGRPNRLVPRISRALQPARSQAGLPHRAAPAEPPAQARPAPAGPPVPADELTSADPLAPDRATLPGRRAQGNGASSERSAPLPRRVPGASPRPRPSAPVAPPVLPASLPRLRPREAMIEPIPAGDAPDP